MDNAVSTNAGYELVEILRPTRDGGTMRLYDPPRIDACCACGAGEPIGLAVLTTLQGAPTLDIAVCAGCMSEALAILLGRRHVQAGGDVADLAARDDLHGPAEHVFSEINDDGFAYCEPCGVHERSAVGRWEKCSRKRGMPGGPFPDDH